MEAVIYARYSPRRNAADCESIETQVELCRSHAEALGWPVAGVYTDEAMSGAEEDRPGLWEAVDALGPDRVLLVYRRDRLARDVYLEEVIHRAVAQKGAKVHALHGQNGDSPEDTVVRQVLAAFSEYERKVTAARTRIAMRRHQANGRKMSSKPPYG